MRGITLTLIDFRDKAQSNDGSVSRGNISQTKRICLGKMSDYGRGIEFPNCQPMRRSEG